MGSQPLVSTNLLKWVETLIRTWNRKTPNAHHALEREENLIASGDVSRWTSGNHKMRVEEVGRVQDMINQLIATLHLPYLCLTYFDHGAVGLLRMILKRFPANTWKNLPGDLTVSSRSRHLYFYLSQNILLQDEVPSDSELAHYLAIIQHAQPHGIRSILFLTLINRDHFVLFEHRLVEQCVICHNSLQTPPQKSNIHSCYENYDTFVQVCLSYFFCSSFRLSGLPEGCLL